MEWPDPVEDPAAPVALQCDHAVEGVECSMDVVPTKSYQRFNVTTPLKAWNDYDTVTHLLRSFGFNVTTPLKAWNGGNY